MEAVKTKPLQTKEILKKGTPRGLREDVVDKDELKMKYIDLRIGANQGDRLLLNPPWGTGGGFRS